MDNVHTGSPDASNDTQWAWAAGFFDGEGNIGIRRNCSKTSKNPSFSLNVKVAQIERYPLEKIQEMVGGGSIQKLIRKRQRQGKMQTEIYHSFEVTGSAALRFLESMLPCLTVKQERAKIGIKFRKIIESRGNTGSRQLTPEQIEEGQYYYNLMKKLNEPKSIVCSSND